MSELKLTIYSLTYNEELLLPFMIDHYRERFPSANIVLFDNASTDRTVEIATQNNCEVRDYSHLSGHTLNDAVHCQIKNNCWKNAPTDWVLVSDLDELVDINAEQLQQEQELGTTRIRTEGWQMVNMEDNYDIANMKYASRSDRYDKFVLFNKQHIKEINYQIGAHDCKSIGNVVDSQQAYKLYHYRFINPELFIKKSKTTSQRMSDINKANGWGFQAHRGEQEFIDEFETERSKAIKIR